MPPRPPKLTEALTSSWVQTSSHKMLPREGATAASSAIATEFAILIGMLPLSLSRRGERRTKRKAGGPAWYTVLGEREASEMMAWMMAQAVRAPDCPRRDVTRLVLEVAPCR